MVALKKSRKVQTPGEAPVQAGASQVDAMAAPVVVDQSDGLPDADSIDASKLTSAVLTKQGWLLPHGGADVNV